LVKHLQLYGYFHNILQKTSGGIIHGYVGNMFHASHLKKLKEFPLPDCARFVDDQWVSIFCFLHSIKISPTHAEDYKDIFKVLMNGLEKYDSKDSLSSLNNRDQKIKELEHFFNIYFEKYNCIKLLV